MSSLKPIIVYTLARGPNPYKVLILLEELGIPYTEKVLEMGNGENGHKGPDFLKIVKRLLFVLVLTLYRTPMAVYLP